MREIKFRAAHYKYDGTFYGFTYWGRIDSNMKTIQDKSCYASPSMVSGTQIKHEDQYTGLKDKNGVEIYEGDIVKYYHSNGSNYDTGPSIIKYENCNFALKKEDRKVFNIWLGSKQLELLEVIGNIYENTELIK